MLPSLSAVAGAAGSPVQIVSTSKAIGNYVINDTNFPGIGRFLPCVVMVIGATPANVTCSISIDNGSNWLAGTSVINTVYADAGGTTGQGGGVSTAQTVRVNVATGTTVVHLLPCKID